MDLIAVRPFYRLAPKGCGQRTETAKDSDPFRSNRRRHPGPSMMPRRATAARTVAAPIRRGSATKLLSSDVSRGAPIHVV